MLLVKQRPGKRGLGGQRPEKKGLGEKGPGKTGLLTEALYSAPCLEDDVVALRPTPLRAPFLN